MKPLEENNFIYANRNLSVKQQPKSYSPLSAASSTLSSFSSSSNSSQPPLNVYSEFNCVSKEKNSNQTYFAPTCSNSNDFEAGSHLRLPTEVAQTVEPENYFAGFNQQSNFSNTTSKPKTKRSRETSMKEKYAIYQKYSFALSYICKCL